MIRRLTLKNFQAWPSIDLPLSPITVVIGETNAGKSSLLRGLACVLFNAFEGQGMVRQGAQTAEVSLELEDGTTVGWSRGNGVNRYTLDDQVFDKPGRTVPTPIQEALQVRELEFDGETVRMQWAPQMDAPFLLADSGAKATRMLGVAGNAAILAQATRLAQQESRSQQDALRAATAQLERLTEHLASFADVEAAEPLAEALRQALLTYDETAQRRSKLQELHTQHVSASARKEGLVRSLREAEAMVARLARLAEVQETITTLRSGERFSLEKHKLQTRVTDAERLRDACQSCVRASELRTLFEASAATRAQVLARRADLTASEHHLSECRTNHDALVASLTCPTCGRLKEAA